MLIDTDEVIVPTTHNSYTSMLEHLEKQPRAVNVGAWQFNSIYFLNLKQTSLDIPSHYNMLNRVYHRNRKANVKSIVSTDEVLTFDNHVSTNCFTKGGCKKIRVSEDSIGRTHHYRKSCPPNAGNLCTELEKVSQFLLHTIH